MTHVVLVALGAAAGSTAFLVAWRHRWGWRRVLALNVGVSALAGAVAGGLLFASEQNVLFSFLSYGLLGTAAPFASSLVPVSTVRNATDAWRLVRRVAGILSVNTICCATAASATYMVIAGTFFAVNVGAFYATSTEHGICQTAPCPAVEMNV
jgi:hypothetical protein